MMVSFKIFQEILKKFLFYLFLIVVFALRKMGIIEDPQANCERTPIIKEALSHRI